MIIPLKHEDYGELKSIRMSHPDYGTCLFCFCEFKEVEDSIKSGWKIEKDQKHLDEWLSEAIDKRP